MKKNKKNFLTLTILAFYLSFTIFGFSYKNVEDNLKETIFFCKNLVNFINLNFLDNLKEVLDVSNLVKTLPKQSKKNQQQDERNKLIDLVFINCNKDIFKTNLQYFNIFFVFYLVLFTIYFNKNNFVYSFYTFTFIFLKLLKFLFFTIYAPRSGIPESVILSLRVLVLSHKFLWDKIKALPNKIKKLTFCFKFSSGFNPLSSPLFTPFLVFSPFIANERGLNSLVNFSEGGFKNL